MVIVDRMRGMWWSAANCFQNVRKKRKDFVVSEKFEWRTGTKFRARFPLMDGWSIVSRLSVATVRTLESENCCQYVNRQSNVCAWLVAHDASFSTSK